MKWWLALGVVGLVVALTAIDKSDEQSCKDLRVSNSSSIFAERAAEKTCKGFLPW